MRESGVGVGGFWEEKGKRKKKISSMKKGPVGEVSSPPERRRKIPSSNPRYRKGKVGRRRFPKKGASSRKDEEKKRVGLLRRTSQAEKDLS